MPICRQQLRGWSLITHKEAQCLTTILRTLKLSRDNNLFLTDLSEEGFVDDMYEFYHILLLNNKLILK